MSRRARHRAVRRSRTVPLRRTAATVGVAAAVGGVAVGGYGLAEGRGSLDGAWSSLSGLVGSTDTGQSDPTVPGAAAERAADAEEGSRGQGRRPLAEPMAGLPATAEQASGWLERDLEVRELGDVREAERRAEAARLAAERAEAERLAAERAEAERLAAEEAEAARLAAEEAAAEEAAEPSAPVDPSSNRAVAQAMLPEYGWGDADQWSCLDSLWDKESRWSHTARNPSSGAYGIPQSLPGSKMATAGDDWETNPETQIRWGLGYIDGRYGTPCAAWAHSEENNWY